MQKEKEARAKIQIIFSALLFAVVVVAEFYSAVNYPKQYLAIGIFGVLILLSLFFLTNSIFTLLTVKEERREEQYDSIFKSEKASYLLLKKYFEQIDEKIDLLQDSSRIPTEEIVNAQKGVAKVIINRSRENAEALMNSNDLVMDKLYEFEDKLSANSKEILAGQKENESEGINELILKHQELVSSLKDMELRINQAIMQTQQIISSNPVQLTANVEIPPQPISVAQVPQMMTMPVQPMVAESVPVAQPVSTAVSEQTPEIQVIPEEAAEVPAEEPIAEPVVEEAATEVPAEEPVAEPVVEEAAMEVPVEEPVAEPVVEEAATEVPVEEPVAEPVVEEAATEIAVEEPVVEEAPAEKPPMPDLSDPNAKMSADDIAALFANMAGDDAPAAEPAVEEIPVVEEPVEEPAVEEAPAEKPPMPDLSDPNAKMSADDIAALFANMAGDDAPAAESAVEEIPVVEEPVAEPAVEEAPAEKPPMPDMSDPNAKMSPDEIAALFANMNGDDAPAEVPVAEEPAEEEKPPMPDMSDPNKMMSPDDIAALIANM